MKKRILVLLLAVSLLFTASMPAFAAEKTPALTTVGSSGGSGLIQPEWTNTDVVIADLSFDGDLAYVDAFIYGKSGTTKITATATLARVTSSGTKTIKSWTGLSASGDSLYFDSEYYVTSGYTYKFTINGWVYRNGTSEYVTEYVYAYCG